MSVSVEGVHDGGSGTRTKVKDGLGIKGRNSLLQICHDALKTTIRQGHLPGNIGHALLIPVLGNRARELIGSHQWGERLIGGAHLWKNVLRLYLASLSVQGEQVLKCWSQVSAGIS